jgi:hypothetical protein
MRKSSRLGHGPRESLVRLRDPGLPPSRVPSTKRSKDNFRSTKTVPYLQDRACHLILVQRFPQRRDMLLCDFTEFGRMTLLCVGFALVRAITKDGCQWTLPCLPRRAIPRAHERLRLMRG